VVIRPISAPARLRSRGFRLLPGAVALAVIGVQALPIAAVDAQAAGCPTSSALPSDPAAETMMASLEADFRRDPRIVRMDIATRYTGSRGLGPDDAIQPSRKTLWGVFNGDGEDTRLLYVFSGPGRLAGTTLLMHDRAGSAEADAMWLYLRSFDIFKLLEPKAQKVMVPGTALTYEDSRGFIPAEKYRFSFDTSPRSPTPAHAMSLLGCPRSEEIREHLGYHSLRLQVDREKNVVIGVQYTGLGGRPLKSYALVRDLELEGRVLPAEVRLEHRADGFISTIGYEHWLPGSPPPAALFDPSPDGGKFIDRLKAYLTEVGLGDRIQQELELADEQLREFEEKLRRIQEGQ